MNKSGTERVLDLLEAGKVTPEEAERLLKALKGRGGKRVVLKVKGGEGRRGRGRAAAMACCAPTDEKEKDDE